MLVSQLSYASNVVFYDTNHIVDDSNCKKYNCPTGNSDSGNNNDSKSDSVNNNSTQKAQTSGKASHYCLYS